ncbi:hypothetical protein D3C85_1049520 [compost metagenome]
MKFKAGLQGFEGHAVAHMTESRLIEIEAQSIGGAVLRRVQPEDLCLGINETADQPGTSQAINPRAFAGCPNTILIVTTIECRNLLVAAMGFIRR